MFVYRRERVVNLDKAPVMKFHRVDTMNNTAFQAAREAAKLPMVRVHDLRHTYAQRLRDAGVSEEDRMALTGHSTRESHQIYSHTDEAALRDAIAKLPSLNPKKS